MQVETVEKLVCYHCGEDCADDHIHIKEKNFCCEGCKMVYEIINQ
ncbi:MAG: heavy metal translocating P-type ATPase metal-binding domain-containing protein, partial [Bacteroidia bacterium]